MSAWTMIAEAIAAKYGVEDDLFVRDRIGKINEDRMNDREVSAKEFKNGSDGVQFGGKGVGGNAVARFGDGENSDEAAAEFAAIINSIKQLGLAEEVLVQDELNFADLAVAAGSGFARDRVGSIDDDAEVDFNTNGPRSDGTFGVGIGGTGIGGNAIATFETNEQALAFEGLVDLLAGAGLADELLL